MSVVVFDYGAGNLHSLAKALERAGAEVRIETDAERLLAADALVLPGVGAFDPATACLGAHRDALRRALAGGFPCLGICLGMQLLFESSDEGQSSGVAVFRGRVRRLRAPRVPHMGWNHVQPASEDGLLRGVGEVVAYFAHSYAAEPEDVADVLAWTTYEDERFASVVRRGCTWGVQFHPEKSGTVGIELLRNFLEEARGA